MRLSQARGSTLNLVIQQDGFPYPLHFFFFFNITSLCTNLFKLIMTWLLLPHPGSKQEGISLPNPVKLCLDKFIWKPAFANNYRTTKYCKLEGIHKDHESPTPGLAQATPGITPCARERYLHTSWTMSQPWCFCQYFWQKFFKHLNHSFMTIPCNETNLEIHRRALQRNNLREAEAAHLMSENKNH